MAQSVYLLAGPSIEMQSKNNICGKKKSAERKIKFIRIQKKMSQRHNIIE